jgi:apolipoprotein N-acyltransferase
MIHLKRILLVLVSAGLLIISFNDKFSFVAWFALIPYFLVIPSFTLGKSVLYSWLTGICFFTGITYWFTAYSFMFWFPILGILSLSFVFFGIAFYFVYSMIRLPVLRIIIISSIWTAVEFFRHRTFLAFPWGVLGYSQHNYLPVMQISKLTGVLGISILIVLFNLCIAEMLIYFINSKKTAVLSGIFYNIKGKPGNDSEGKEHQYLKAGVSSCEIFKTTRQKHNYLEAEFSNKRTEDISYTTSAASGKGIPLLNKNVKQKNFIKTNKKVIIPAICVALAVIINISAGAVYLALNKDSSNGYSNRKINVALVQPNITFEAKFDTDTDVLIPQKTGTAGKYFKAGTELVVFPESVIWGAIERDRNKSFYEWVKNSAKNEGLHFIMGQILWDTQEHYYNAVQLYTPDLQIIGRYNKMHPLPCAEYMPYPNALGFLSFMNIAKLNITPVKEFVLIDYPGKGKIGANICFESTLPIISRTFRKLGADVLFTFTDTAGFEDSLAARYHLVFSQVRAVENNSFMVHSGNNGISAIIDPNGKILAQTSLVKKEVLYGTIYLNGNISFYSRYGELVIYIYFALTFIYLLVYLIRINSKKTKKQHDSILPG